MARLVAVPTESEEAGAVHHLVRHLIEHMRPLLKHMGFVGEVLCNRGRPVLCWDLATTKTVGMRARSEGRNRSRSQGVNVA